VEREIVVRGESEVRVMPDRVTVRVLAGEEGSTQPEAYAAAARVAAAVDEVLTQTPDAFDRMTTTALVVQPRIRWDNGQAVQTGWTASRSSSVEIDDLDRVGELLERLVQAGAAISGLSWEVDPGHPGYGQARQQAAEDAHRRASDYAAALGLRIGAVAWVAEPGLRSGGPVSPPMRALHAAAVGPGAPEPISVAPEELALHATVDVGFALAARSYEGADAANS
jgi:uncharacterized protein YggE